ncbi:MAG: thiosulfate oxidation carrier protein SoxY [Gammaproteobacteria bacterium]
MPDNRRHFLKQSAVIGAYTVAATAGFITPRLGFAQWLAQNFTQAKLDDTLVNLYAGMDITETDKIDLKLPRIAENGAVVPITVSAHLDEVESIAILVEKNPVPLSATFKLSPAVEPTVSARLKMAETSDVIAIVKAGNALYSNRQKVKVTIGGCGG